MGTFSTNQVRNLFIVDTVNAAENPDPATLANLEIALESYPTFDSAAGPEIAFMYNGPYEGVLRSDLIKVNKIKDIRYIPTTGTYTPQQTTVTITNAVVGQNYILRITFNNWGSGSAEDQYFIYTSYKAKTADTPTTIAAALVSNLQKTLAREAAPYFTITNTGPNIVLTEVLPSFVLGKKSGEPYTYQMQLVDILDVNGVETTAGTVAVTQARVVPKGWGRTIADMEWFYDGERADIYRGMGYPSNFRGKYVADPDANYNVLEIKFYFSGDNEMVQESVKQLTIASTAALTDLVTLIETATGLTIPVVA